MNTKQMEQFIKKYTQRYMSPTVQIDYSGAGDDKGAFEVTINGSGILARAKKFDLDEALNECATRYASMRDQLDADKKAIEEANRESEGL